MLAGIITRTSGPYIKNLKRDSSGIPLKKDWLLISENNKKAEALNDQFRSVFTKEDMISFPSSTKPCMPDIHGFKDHHGRY